MKGRLIVLAGPSAVGKGTIAQYIIHNYPGFHLSISATTREPRAGESDGVSYFFVSKQEFENQIKAGQMLEWALVHGQNLYGTPKDPVLRALEDGLNVILEIDVQGAKQVKQSFPDALLVFVQPPSFDELVSRLEKRGTEGQKERKKRLETAEFELKEASSFDFVVINDEVPRCAQEVVELTKAN